MKKPVIDYLDTQDFNESASCYRCVSQTNQANVILMFDQLKNDIRDKTAYADLAEACNWALEQFKRLADEGRYPEFMLSNNGGEGVMPLVNALKKAGYTE